MATHKQPELPTHAEVTAAYAALVSSIHDLHANNVERLERAKTKEHVAKATALAAAASDHLAARIERNAAVVSETIAALSDAWASFEVSREMGRAEILGKIFRAHDERTERILGHGITDELWVATCNHFAQKYPKALARFAAEPNQIRQFDDGLKTAGNRANAALRNPHDIVAAQRALLDLESTVARIGTAPGFPEAHPDEVEELWAIVSAVLPSDLEQDRRKALADVAKVKAIAVAIAEQELRVAAVRGSAAAREALNSRGPGVLEAVLACGASILHQALGHSEERPAP